MELTCLNLKCYLHTSHFGLPRVNRPELWENSQRKRLLTVGQLKLTNALQESD